MGVLVGNLSGVAKGIVKPYVGVAGAAKNVSAVYAGDSSGVARKVWPDLDDQSAWCVMCGNNGRITYLLPGELFESNPGHSFNVPYVTNWYDIGFFNNQYVMIGRGAVGANNYIPLYVARSTKGTSIDTWEINECTYTPRTAGISEEFHGICWCGGYYFICSATGSSSSSPGQVMQSSDLVTWTYISPPPMINSYAAGKPNFYELDCIPASVSGTSYDQLMITGYMGTSNVRTGIYWYMQFDYTSNLPTTTRSGVRDEAALYYGCSYTPYGSGLFMLSGWGFLTPTGGGDHYGVVTVYNPMAQTWYYTRSQPQHNTQATRIIHQDSSFHDVFGATNGFIGTANISNQTGGSVIQMPTGGVPSDWQYCVPDPYNSDTRAFFVGRYSSRAVATPSGTNPNAQITMYGSVSPESDMYMGIATHDPVRTANLVLVKRDLSVWLVNYTLGTGSTTPVSYTALPVPSGPYADLAAQGNVYTKSNIYVHSYYNRVVLGINSTIYTISNMQTSSAWRTLSFYSITSMTYNWDDGIYTGSTNTSLFYSDTTATQWTTIPLPPGASSCIRTCSQGRYIFTFNDNGYDINLYRYSIDTQSWATIPLSGSFLVTGATVPLTMYNLESLTSANGVLIAWGGNRNSEGISVNRYHYSTNGGSTWSIPASNTSAGLTVAVDGFHVANSMYTKNGAQFTTSGIWMINAQGTGVISAGAAYGNSMVGVFNDINNNGGKSWFYFDASSNVNLLIRRSPALNVLYKHQSIMGTKTEELFYTSVTTDSLL